MDTDVDPVNFKLQNATYSALGANVSFDLEPHEDHEPDPVNFDHEILPGMFQFLYENLPKSGITKEKPLAPSSFIDPKASGRLLRFDQEKIIKDIALNDPEHGIRDNGQTEEEPTFHQLLKWGYVYYPLACVGKDMPEGGCLFHMVSNGCGDNARNIADVFVPIA